MARGRRLGELDVERTLRVHRLERPDSSVSLLPGGTAESSTPPGAEALSQSPRQRLCAPPPKEMIPRHVPQRTAGGPPRREEEDRHYQHSANYFEVAKRLEDAVSSQWSSLRGPPRLLSGDPGLRPHEEVLVKLRFAACLLFPGAGGHRSCYSTVLRVPLLHALRLLLLLDAAAPALCAGGGLGLTPLLAVNQVPAYPMPTCTSSTRAPLFSALRDPGRPLQGTTWFLYDKEFHCNTH